MKNFCFFGALSALALLVGGAACSAAPISLDDDADVYNVNQSIDVHVLGNDYPDYGPGATGAPIDESTVEIVYAPTVGTATVDPISGVISYTTSTALSEDVTFSYRVYDEENDVSNMGWVTVSPAGEMAWLIPNGEAPQASDDEVECEPDDWVTIDVLSNDMPDIDSQPIDATTVEICLQPLDGSVSIDSQTGEITYTAPSNFSEDDMFSYRVKDSAGEYSDPAWVTVSPSSGY